MCSLGRTGQQNQKFCFSANAVKLLTDFVNHCQAYLLDSCLTGTSTTLDTNVMRCLSEEKHTSLDVRERA